jgi:threonine/homoserine/homoserine lactone efflux protein
VTTALANPQTGVFLATTLPAMFAALTPTVIIGATLTVALVNFAWYVVGKRPLTTVEHSG